MRQLLLIPAALAGFFVGCNDSPEGGTPNTNSTFKLSLPAVSKDVKQGTAETYDGSISRGSDFKKDVRISVTKPEGVDVKLNKDMIKANEDTKFTMTVTADKKAALGEHLIKVTATPEGGGAATTGEFKVNVLENK